jgi:hypothetical protein
MFFVMSRVCYGVFDGGFPASAILGSDCPVRFVLFSGPWRAAWPASGVLKNKHLLLGDVMNDRETHDMGVVFGNLEVLSLCDSVKEAHLALSALGRIIEDLKAPVFSKPSTFSSECYKRGFFTVSEKLIEEQRRRLKRMMDIYGIEAERLRSVTGH